jgi:hypothetical protein
MRHLLYCIVSFIRYRTHEFLRHIRETEFLLYCVVSNATAEPPATLEGITRARLSREFCRDGLVDVTDGSVSEAPIIIPTAPGPALLEPRRKSL